MLLPVRPWPMIWSRASESGIRQLVFIAKPTLSRRSSTASCPCLARPSPPRALLGNGWKRDGGARRDESGTCTCARALPVRCAAVARARAHDCASGHASEGAAFHGRGRGRLTAVSRIYVYLDAQKELAAVIAPPSGEDDAAGAPEAQAPYAGPGGPKGPRA